MSLYYIPLCQWFLEPEWCNRCVVFQLLSCVWIIVTPWTAARQASLSITTSLSLLKFISIDSVMPLNYLILCCPLLLLPSIFPSIRVFSNESTLHIRWPKYQSLGFSISPSNEYSGLISFRIDWLDLLARKLSSGHRAGKSQFSFKFQRKAMPKNVHILHNCTHLTC